MKRWCCLLLAMLLLCVGASAQTAYIGREITPQAMQGDLSEFAVQLKRRHVALFGNVSEQAWDGEVARIRAAIPGMTPAQFYYELKHLAAMAGDAHTTVEFSVSKYAYLRALPFAIGRYADGWRLLMLEDAQAEYLGWELTAINGVAMDEVLERAKAIISCENDIWAEQQLSNTINFIDALVYIGIAAAEDDSITLHIRPDAEREETLLEVVAMDETAIMSANIASFAPETVLVTGQGGYYRAFWLEAGVMYVQYNVCAEAADMPMADFTATVLEMMNESGADTLVFDLRYNTGGDSTVIEPFLAEMQAYRQAHGLTVYTLIGGSTFSSGTIAMIQSKWLLDAVLVGTPTGGAMTCYGDVRSFTLPNMPLTVGYSTKYFEFVEGMPFGEPMHPDVYVDMTFEAYRTGSDAVIDWVLQQQ